MPLDVLRTKKIKPLLNIFHESVYSTVLFLEGHVPLSRVLTFEHSSNYFSSTRIRSTLHAQSFNTRPKMAAPATAYAPTSSTTRHQRTIWSRVYQYSYAAHSSDFPSSSRPRWSWSDQAQDSHPSVASSRNATTTARKVIDTNFNIISLTEWLNVLFFSSSQDVRLERACCTMAVVRKPRTTCIQKSWESMSRMALWPSWMWLSHVTRPRRFTWHICWDGTRTWCGIWSKRAAIFMFAGKQSLVTLTDKELNV